jgi:CDGSH-type Zn-finger protein
MRIDVTKNGPYRVTGNVPLARQVIETDDQGTPVRWAQGEEFQTDREYFLCRCGRSANKPFCDGTHKRVGFDGTEAASTEPYLAQADEFDGPEVALLDAPSLCAYARFCDANGQIWNLVEVAGTEDEVRRQAGDCPSGRLQAWDLESRTPMEPDLPPSIGVVSDPALGVAGPLWIRGRIPVTAADGTEYETRNRMTLCRCGASWNKPFCDGSHAAIGFQEGRPATAEGAVPGPRPADDSRHPVP